MSIDNSNIIDFISTSGKGKVVLTISDYHQWNENGHLQLLQEKINAYLLFIESGQILNEYPNAVDKEMVIETVFKYEPNHEALSFLKKAEQVITGIGVGFQWKVLESDGK